MISLPEAQHRLLALAAAISPRIEAVPIAEAANRYLMTDILARRSQPAQDLSAMDGYAVCGDGPWRILGESAAGAPWPGTLGGGEAVRIFTGAVVPSGSLCVVMQEDVTRDGIMASLSGTSELRSGRHIRLAGSDFVEDQLLVRAGTKLSPAHLALAVSGGHGHVEVRTALRVAILSTGNELVPAGLPVADGQIPASNGLMLAALLRSEGISMIDMGTVPDDLEATKSAIIAARDCDVIITIGGASVGDHDLVRPALLDLGAEIDFWKVAMKPGKPLMAGILGEAIVLGLPGNPVSAFVTALLFARPVLEALRGNPDPLPRPRKMVLGADLPAAGNRTDHIRAFMKDGQVFPVGVNDSAALLALSQAELLIVRAADSPSAQKGISVDVLDLT